jgi:hypothetical protein
MSYSVSRVNSANHTDIFAASEIDKHAKRVVKKSEKNDHKVPTHTAVAKSMSAIPNKQGRVETDQVKTTSGQVHQKGVTPKKSGKIFNKNNMLTTSEFANKNGKTPSNGGQIIANIEEKLALACGGPGSGRKPTGSFLEKANTSSRLAKEHRDMSEQYKDNAEDAQGTSKEEKYRNKANDYEEAAEHFTTAATHYKKGNVAAGDKHFVLGKNASKGK